MFKLYHSEETIVFGKKCVKIYQNISKNLRYLQIFWHVHFYSGLVNFQSFHGSNALFDNLHLDMKENFNCNFWLRFTRNMVEIWLEVLIRCHSWIGTSRTLNLFSFLMKYLRQRYSYSPSKSSTPLFIASQDTVLCYIFDCFSLG